jgi:hypothetical protein
MGDVVTINGVRFEVKARVRAYLPTGNHCYGWVEAVGKRRIGVRLANGNFRWLKPGDVTPESMRGDPDPFGYEDK